MQKLESNEREIWLRKEKLQDNKTRQEQRELELKNLKEEEAKLNKEIEEFQENSLSTYYKKVSQVRAYFKQVAPAKVAMAERVLQPELLPPLVKICTCESRLQQYDEYGKVTKNPKTPDYGICQINEPTWGDEAKEFGFDIMKKEGNIVMANVIFAAFGAQPWYPSKSCHGMA